MSAPTSPPSEGGVGPSAGGETSAGADPSPGGEPSPRADLPGAPPAGRRARRVTVTDVARAAAVSIATVSYVLSDKPGHRVPPETAQRVRETATALGYRPSLTARALRLGRSDVVLALLPAWPVGYAHDRAFELLAEALEDVGLTLVASLRGGGRAPWTAEAWRGITPVAIIAFGSMSPAEVAALAREGVIVVHWFADEAAEDDPRVPPYVALGGLQVAHLVERGHTRLAYARPADAGVHLFAEARLRGARAECAARGITDLAVATLAPAEDGARLAVQGWQALRVTAVAAYNDDVALAVLGAAYELEVQVPTQLAVIGIDDSPAAAAVRPALTSIAIDHSARARAVVASLVARRDGRAEPVEAELPRHVVVQRSST